MPLNSSDHLGQTVGAKLRAARLAKKYTQNQLAQPDFSVSYISAIERGQIQPSLRALEILAQRLGLNSAHLLPQQRQMLSGVPVALRSSSLADEERMWLLLEAQLELHQGNSAQAIALLRPLLLKKSERHLYMGVYYLLGWAYLEGGYLQEGEHALAEAASLAQEAADPLYPRILSLQGAVYTAMYKMEQAISFQQASLVALEQWPALAGDSFFQAQVALKLGQAYAHLGQPARAVELFQQALAFAQTSPSSVPALYQRLSECYQQSAELFWATLFHYKRLQVDLQTRLAGMQREIQHSLGRALLKSQPDEAYVALLALSQQTSSRQDPLAQASVRVHLAAWCLTHTQDFNQVESYLREALTLTEPFGETLIRADALLLQGKLAYAQQAYEQGDHCFTSALAMFERLQIFEELRDHLTLYARLLEERGLIQQALIYWKQAYECSQKN